MSPSFAAIADLHGWQAGCSSGLAAALLALAAAGCGLAVICCCQTKVLFSLSFFLFFLFFFSFQSAPQRIGCVSLCP